MGCAAGRRAGEAPATGSNLSPHPTQIAPILHVVFVRLKDPLDTAALADDSLAMVEQVPSIRAAFVGLHLETGRESVVRDYDLCLTLTFDDAEGYEAYLAHPAHTAILAKWGGRIEWIKISDARDVRP